MASKRKRAIAEGTWFFEDTGTIRGSFKTAPSRKPASKKRSSKAGRGSSIRRDAARNKRASRLHGLAGTPAEHAQEAKTYYGYFKDAEKGLLGAIKRKNCSLGLNQLEQMAEFRGRVIANMQDATDSAALEKMHDHVTSDARNLTGKFFAACVAKKGTGFSGLGRTRKSRRSRR